MSSVHVGEIELSYEVRGAVDDPVFLLVSGLGRSMVSWDDGFCDRLVEQGFRVLRFDNRDTGHSTHLHDVVPDLAAVRKGKRDAAPYTLDDMADDAAGLLDALGADRAHVAGTSMGGMIAQTLAIRHPERVRTMCSIMSTTGAPDVGRPTAEAMAVVMQPPPSDRAGYVDTELANARIIGSRGALADEQWRRSRYERLYDRGIDPAGTARQIMAIMASGDRTASLHHVSVPTSVIHGDVDTLVPLDGGDATARAIPGAQLLVIKEMGHELPPGVWDEVIGAMTANARRGGAASARPDGAANILLEGSRPSAPQQSTGR
jgi:pimeloyl-ACP methyl ester carboxylesterase